MKASIAEEFDAAVKKIIPEGLDGIENFKYEPVKRDGSGCFCRDVGDL